MEQETLEYRLKKLEEQNESILISISELKDSLPDRYISKELYQAQLADLEARVKDLEATQNTAFCSFLAAGGSLIMTIGRAILGV